MGLFGLFGKKTRAEAAPAEPEPAYLEDYAGMQAEVTDLEGRPLFTAKLLGVEEDHGNLHLLGDAAFYRDTEEPLPVRLRGYSGRRSKAAYLEGEIRPSEDTGIWRVEKLTLSKLENDRSYFRMDVAMDAALTPVGRPGAAEEPCRLVDLSIGGVRIASPHQFQTGERLLISAVLTPGGPPSTMLCQILRVVGQEADYEYGCRFLELNEADEDRIVQIIFDLQRKRSGRI